MGERETFIINAPGIYVDYLEKNNLLHVHNKVFIDILTECLIDVSKALLHNNNGVVSMDSVFEELKEQGYSLTSSQEDELIEVFKIASVEILNVLVLNNIHNRLFYVNNYSKNHIILITYDGPLHNPERS